MKVLKMLLFGAAAAGIAWGVWYVYFRDGGAEYVYRTQPVTRGSISATVSATGSVNPVEMVDVGTQVSGTLKEIYVDYNSRVTKGQLVATLDTDMLQSRVDEAKASLALAQARVTSARASAADADRTFKRNKELWSRNLIARSELDAAETKLSLARASLAEHNAQVVQARASLKQAETSLGYARIVSPVDGVVIARKVDVGQTVAASLQTPTLFSIARDLTRMQIEASVDEADIGRIAEGQKAICRFDAWPDTTFEGTVTQVRLKSTVVSNVVTYTVIIRVDNSELKLKPSMTANVTIVTEEKKDVLKVPAAALRFTPPGDVLAALSAPSGTEKEEKGAGSIMGLPPMRRRNGNRSDDEDEPVVWVVEGGKLVGSVPVGEQGISDRTWVEVSNTQLEEGQELAVAFSTAGAAGAAVVAGGEAVVVRSGR
ncbi:efflux RND transporter periplasmic adaptor subunit [uncultured Fretibacterium sp.]|uniref:efflux RND transporter periplasmic adaptor subunit n=1 Tax=uncultured Fretibacterium sp. TaxID=1678694 RepID=UPI0026066284|nr:efflux RND transporter periplasmic adaptor subunit [uncultured Fretibacterium sp.]